jgi:hypothetical protein
MPPACLVAMNPSSWPGRIFTCRVQFQFSHDSSRCADTFFCSVRAFRRRLKAPIDLSEGARRPALRWRFRQRPGQWRFIDNWWAA